MSRKALQVVLMKLIERVFYFLLGWLIIIPITYIIPKDQRLVLFKGSSNNVKYLYFYASQRSNTEGTRVYYLTRNEELISRFSQFNFPVLPYPSLSSYWLMFRAGTYIVDNHISPLNYYIFYRSNKVQLWHGIPLKHIGPSSIKGIKKLPPGFLKNLAMRIAFYPTYDMFMSTSDFYTKEMFASTIKTKQFIDYGYPRNDVLFSKLTIDESLWGSDEKNNHRIAEAKEKGWQVILVAPTFRDTGGDPITDKAVDLEQLNEFGRLHNILFVFKFHPTTRAHSLIHGLSNCIEYDKGKDIYPMMSSIDMIITDYSSIYLDYLLLKRPVLFFPYDYEKYTQKDRDLQVDYNWITPGPKCSNQQELLQEISNMLIEKKDRYVNRRQEILDIAFKYQDGKAAIHIWNTIKQCNKIA